MPVTVWEMIRAVLRTRNLAAQEGDARFREVRAVANRRFMLGFAALVEAGQASGAVAAEITPAGADTDPRAYALGSGTAAKSTKP